MTPEKKENIEQNEQQLPTIEGIKTEIDKHLVYLGGISSNNENLAIINKKVELHKNNEQALSVINEGLKKIMDSVDKIAIIGEDKKGKIYKDMIASIEEYEQGKELRVIENKMGTMIA